MRLVDHAEIERRARAELLRAALAAGPLAADQEDSGTIGVDARLRRLERRDPEQREQLVLPLANQSPRQNDQNPFRALGEQLGDDQSSLDSLAQADLVGQDTAALRDPLQREHDRVDLVRVRVDTALTLRGCVATSLASAASADQVLRVVPTMNWVEARHQARLSVAQSVTLRAFLGGVATAAGLQKAGPSVSFAQFELKGSSTPAGGKELSGREMLPSPRTSPCTFSD